jgi:putative transposase
MIDRGHELPLARQAALLKLSRGSLYYTARPVTPADLAVMRRIDELHLDYPFAGSRMLRDLLRGEGVVIGRDRVVSMMRRMRIETIYCRPNTSKPSPGHKIYPYLLRDVAVDRANQVWAMDITYIPMAHGFVYLAAVVDWFSRKVLSWRVSITLEVDFCLEAVEAALAKYAKPEIFNTDQGSQFTSAAFTGLLRDNTIAISMDGQGAWRDNVFVERIWRSVKYEEVYLRAYDSVAEARASIGRYLDFYNGKRPHSSLDARTPDRAYLDHLQGNRLNRLCNEQSDEVAVVPCGGLAIGLDRQLALSRPDEVLRHVPNCGEVGGRVAVADPAFIVAEDHVHDPVQAVLNAPVVADGRCQMVGRQGRGGDVEPPFLFNLIGGFPHAFDHRQRGQAGPVMALAQPVDVVHDGQGPGFDPAVLAIDSLRAAHGGVGKATGELLIGEPFGVFAQAALVALQGEDVVGFLVDDLAGDLALASHRVDAHDGALNLQQI